MQVIRSGNFCGVAEMDGPVDWVWDRDWKGKFPVKWHIVKDVPYSKFHHIAAGNLSIIYSRDTQQVSNILLPIYFASSN